MKYICTRNRMESVEASQAIAQGISASGGLFVPEELPKISHAELCAMQTMDYPQLAQHILAKFLTDFTPEEIKECTEAAYRADKFSGGHPAPLVMLQNGDITQYALELWHGPTCAFKDMALQILPHLLVKSLAKTTPGKTAVILVATSGDTGKAALEGFKDVDGTRVLVFYPQNGVSPMQKRQMVTQEGGNVGVCAIEGNFDDAQTAVKGIFTDSVMQQTLAQHNMMFSSANSINWGRLLPQIVYYFSAYCQLMNSGEIDYEGEKVNFVVPTGNFGNILAAYYAMKMGLPVNRLICASNENNVLTDFIRTGTYNRCRPFHTTISPSMDILVSSNLERLLFDVTGNDAEKVAGWMRQLNETGSYTVDAETLARIQSVFYAGCCDDAATCQTIRKMKETENYLCDTHSAVAFAVYHEYVAETGDKDTPTVVVSTASPYKFAASVLQALGSDLYAQDGVNDEFEHVYQLSALTGTEVPEPIRALAGKAVRFEDVSSVADMRQAVLRLAGLA